VLKHIKLYPVQLKSVYQLNHSAIICLNNDEPCLQSILTSSLLRY